jgi:NitT/TauT family transport system substrate-binding protein
MIKKVLSILLLSIVLSILAACSVLQPAKRELPPLRVEFTQWWGDYTIIIAQEKGFFEKYGVRVEPRYYENFSDTYSELASGQIDGALIAVGDVININHIAEMKVIAVSDDGGNDAIVANPSINSISDLKDKKVGVLIGTQYALMVSEMLQSAGMIPGDIFIVPINPEDAQDALKSNRVDAVYTWEPFLTNTLADGNKVIFPNEQLRLFPDTIVFSKSVVEQRPGEIRAFLKAWFDAVNYRQQNPELTRSIIADYLKKSIEEVQPDDNLKILTLNDNKSLFSIQSEDSLYNTTKRTSDYLISIGALTQQTDPLELLDPSYLP